MSAILIDGKSLAKRVQKELKENVASFVSSGNKPPLLAVVLVGEDPASRVYVASKSKRAIAAGMLVKDTILPASVSNEELQKSITALSNDSEVDGILLQLPLPAELDEFAALGCIVPSKDVDGLHPYSQGLLMRGADGFKPCTPFGCMMLIREGLALAGAEQDLSGLNAVVVGRSVLVGKPMAALLLEANCTVTICHSRTKDLAAKCSEADILVAAVGRPGMIQGSFVKPGAVVIDVGINRTSAGALVGDCEFDSCAERAAAITPVPGGVGPMTIAVLLQNTYYSATMRAQRC